MKAFFIYKDGELVGNPIGYTTKNGALKSLVDTTDWYKCKDPYNHFYLNEDMPEEYKTNGLYEQTHDKRGWLFKRENWSRKIWTPYVKEHYNIVEKEFEIVFKDEN